MHQGELDLEDAFGAAAVAGAPAPVPVQPAWVEEVGLPLTHPTQAGGLASQVSTRPVVEWDLDEKVDRAIEALTALLRSGAPACVSWSAGKDSGVLLNLCLTAALQLKRRGEAVPPIVVTHADTLVENPDVRAHAQVEMMRVREFARVNALPVRVLTATPNLSAQWAVRVIGGRALPPFPGGARDCTSEWKIWPMKRLRKRVLQELERAEDGTKRPEPVVLIGTRYAESATRGASMRERGESDVQVRRGIDEKGKASHLFLSPLAHWTTDDVWGYLGLARGGHIPAYSDFDETFRIYADAMGSSCVIVGEDMSAAAKSSKACGARHGCALCTATGEADKSMENMLASDRRYEYMRGLNRLRNFMADTRWDLSRRNWLGRTIKNGYVRISPDSYAPAMLEELLRYSLTIDAREREEAASLGIRPRFQLVGLTQLFAIDAMWSLQGYHRPFHALAIYKEVAEGARFEVPHVTPFKRPVGMPERYFYVGADFEDGERMMYTGLRSAALEMASFDQEACMGMRELADGRQVLDMNHGEILEFDEESCAWILDEELPRLLREYHDRPSVSATAAYFFYVSWGAMTVKNGQQGEIDEILRRTSWKERNGIAGQVDHELLWERSVSLAEAGAEPTRKQRKRGADGSRSVAHQDLIAAEAHVAAPGADLAAAAPARHVIPILPVLEQVDAALQAPEPREQEPHFERPRQRA